MVNNLKLLIRTNLKTFLSILFLTMLGVGFLVGMKSSVPNLKHTVDSYFNEHNIFDIELTSAIGFTKDDIKKFAELSDIVKIEGSYQKDFVVKEDKGDYVLRVQTYTDDPNTINKFRLIEGKLPKNKNEIVIEDLLYKKKKYQLGDTITLQSNLLHEQKLKIVGIIKSPLYISKNKGTTNLLAGVVNYYAYINVDNVNSDVFSQIYIKVSNPNKIDQIINSIKKLGSDILDNRYAKTIEKYQEKITTGEKKLTIKKTEANNKLKKYEEDIAKAELQLAEAKKNIPTIKEAERILANKKSELASIKIELDNAKAQIDTAKTEYNTALNNYNKVVTEISKLKKQLTNLKNKVNKENAELTATNQKLAKEKLTASDARKKIIDYEISENNDTITANNLAVTSLENALSYVELSLKEYKNTLDNAKKELNSKEKQYEKKYSEYQKALKIVELSSAEEIIKLAETEIAKNEKLLATKKQELAAKKQEVTDELEKYQIELNDAKDYLKYISVTSWTVGTRENIVSYSQYINDINRIENIGNFFPVIFYIVAVLITLTNITRIIEKDRDTIGLYKALGYHNADISTEYLLFALISCLIGSLLGTIIGLYLIPKIFYNIYTIIYYLPTYKYLINYKLIFLAILIALVLVIISAYTSIIKTIRERPAILLRPKENNRSVPNFLEKISFIWKHLSFTNKVTIRNMFKYPKRFIMTILGITGCISLIIAGFNIKTAISNIIPLQFEHIFNFNVELFLKDSLTRNEILNEQTRINKLPEVDSSILAHVKYVYLNNSSYKANLVVPEDSELMLNFVHLENGHQNYKLTNEGAIITKKLAKLLNIQVGDKVKLQDTENNIFNVKITAIVDNYVDNYIYLSKTYYENLLDSLPKYNALFVRTSSLNYVKADLTAKFNETNNISYLIYTSNSQKAYDTLTESLNYIVYILVISAVILAFIVLYNLNSLNVEERKREIATIKVLGFTKKETYQYIENEVTRLTIIGIILGIFCGYIFSNILIKSCELDNLMYDYRINYLNYLYAIIITIIFMVITSLVSRINIKRINMIESLKKIE